jgi:NAD(P)H-flavin reductase
MFKIVKRKAMADGTIVLNEIEASRIACRAQLGQFVILKAMVAGKRIPTTMAVVIYTTVGRSTTYYFRKLKVGDYYHNVVAPLGQPTQLKEVGMGMCGSCRVDVGGKIKFACVDGPEFYGHRVDFESLANRLKAYKAEERQSLEGVSMASQRFTGIE